MDREDIYIISRNSNWSTKNVDTALKHDVYNDALAWKKFLRLFFIVFGVGFSTAGILFFFAYNWNGMNRFAKLGLVETIIVAVVLIGLFARVNTIVKQLFLTAASVLVGALFAVFGQIYQSGATVFDFFLGWTIFVLIWVLVANFAALWALFLYLVNTTVSFYFQSENNHLTENEVVLILVLINGCWLLFFILLSKKYNYFKLDTWLKNLVFIVVVAIAAFGVWEGILNKFDPIVYAILACELLIYILGLRQGFKEKNLIFLASIPFSFIFILSAVWMKLFPKEWMFLFNGVFITVSVGYLIKYLLDLQKKWEDG